MLGVCLSALLALCAVFAGSALAKKVGPEGIFEKFNECPLGAPSLGEGYPSLTVKGEEEAGAGCIFGEAGKESFFQAGKVTVFFKKPILLRGGFEENFNEEAFQFVGARNGETVSREAEPGPSLTEGLDAEKLAEPEKKRYEEYIASGGSTKTTETIELAVPGDDVFLNETNLIEEENEGFGFSVMIHISNKFLGKNCYDGSTVSPISVPFTTGETHPEAPNTPIHGRLGEISFEEESGTTILHIANQHLVNNEYAAPGVAGCGINGGADAAVDAGLGLPSPAGSNATELVGNLYQAGVREVEERIHS
jgi:hypothetical protein